MIGPLHNDLVFHGPMSDARATAAIESFGDLGGQHVVDLGCGWAELLLRTVASDTTATGHGIDTDEGAIARGRLGARGLPVTLEVGDASKWDGEADVLIVNGATHIWGGEPVDHTVNALAAARKRLRRGGRLFLGEGYWELEPTDEQLAAMPIERAEYRSLPDLVYLAQEHGFRLLALSRASRDEWDHFQSRHGLGWEKWLLANPDAPGREEVVARADQHRSWWLRGWQDVLGMAYLTLAAT
ncbi:class I SAM-dependent methyltransferase [Actinokineospora diospyrosa]|uniref:Methyltransferase domain-containing protein n=1 Tax=Actinokineospora diospyrosa TaxID=103728 RepID=A0ABT1IF82_9PSEU|nr:class I SAM-dependent methyltransferase [Actinokineospora diospyrosa]MCP2271314.1 Methyltransferase domain-containing protein [Actinokineospora diospyrosa]